MSALVDAEIAFLDALPATAFAGTRFQRRLRAASTTNHHAGWAALDVVATDVSFDLVLAGPVINAHTGRPDQRTDWLRHGAIDVAESISALTRGTLDNEGLWERATSIIEIMATAKVEFEHITRALLRLLQVRIDLEDAVDLLSGNDHSGPTPTPTPATSNSSTPCWPR